MGLLAFCIHPVRQGFTAVDGGGWGHVQLLPGAAGGGFHPVGVLMDHGQWCSLDNSESHTLWVPHMGFLAPPHHCHTLF
jgi:hypothetical protein